MLDKDIPFAVLTDPEEVNRRAIALFGSYDALLQYLLDQFQAFNSVWARDSRSIGEVLHAHIVVEHFLDQYLKMVYPEIEFDQWQLTFERKVFLIRKSDATLMRAVPGLKALGKIRNKLSHKLHFSVSKDDVQAMVNVPDYGLVRTHVQAAQPIDFKTATPEAIVLDFARWIASTLQTMTGPNQRKLDLVFDMSRNIDGTPAARRESDGAPGSIKRKPPPLGSM